MTDGKLQVAVGQLVIDDLDHQATMDKISRMTARLCAEQQVDLLLWPELAVEGYLLRHIRELPAAEFTRIYEFWAQLAQKHGIHIIASMVELVDDVYYNTAYCWNPQGKAQAKYRKMHVVYGSESELFQIGEESVITVVNGWRVALAICADIGFPEQFRQLAAAGVDLFAVVSDWYVPYDDMWRRLCVARATENMCYLAASDRLGGGKADISFAGHSLIVDPRGDLLAIEPDAECILTATLEKRRIAEASENVYWLSHMRRPELYNKPVSLQK